MSGDARDTETGTVTQMMENTTLSEIRNPFADEPAAVVSIWEEVIANSIAMTPDGRFTVWGTSTGVLHVHDTFRPPISATVMINVDRLSIYTVAISADGSTIAAGGPSGLVHILDPNTGVLLDTFSAIWETIPIVFAVALSGTGDMVVAGCQDSAVCVWHRENSAGTYVEPVVLHGHRNSVCAVAISDTARLIISGSTDWTIRTWDSDAGTPKLIIQNSYSVSAIAITPDGLTIASGDENGELRLWHARTGIRLFTGISAVRGRITSLVFFFKGTQLSSADGTGTIRVWDLREWVVDSTTGEQSPVKEPYGMAIPDYFNRIVYSIQDPVNSMAISEDGTTMMALVGGDMRRVPFGDI